MFLSSAIATLCMLTTVSAFAHEMRPGYLEIGETDSGEYRILWKIPSRSGMRMRIEPILPDTCRDRTVPSRKQYSGSYVERRTVACGKEGLSGKTVFIDGLSLSLTDVLVRVNFADGRSQTVLLKPQTPFFQIIDTQQTSQAFVSYINMGIEHILYGIDHLLFVLGLIFLSSGWRSLLKTITAFTVGHSISLALATFDIIRVPTQPLNAVIALSIVFLAGELSRARRRKVSLTIRCPWVVSFGFGLLHGLGFAGALIALGLPDFDIPPALFFFNVGVEVGQILFVSIVLILMVSLKKIRLELPPRLSSIPEYIIGTTASYWFAGYIATML